MNKKPKYKQYYCTEHNKDITSVITCISCDRGEEHDDYISCLSLRLKDAPEVNVALPIQEINLAEEMALEDIHIPEISQKHLEKSDYILVRKNDGGIGDILITSSVLEKVKKTYNLRLDFETNQRGFEVVQNNPYIDKLCTNGSFSSFPKYDMTIDLFRLPSIYAESRIKGKVNEIYSHIFGISDVDKPKIYLDEDEVNFGRDFIKSDKIKIGLGIRTKVPKKDWPLEYAQRFINILSDKYQVYVFHNEIIDIKNARRVFGLPLRTAISILNQMDVIISPDTAFTHIATSLDKPVIALFGPTSPYKWFPYDYDKATIIRKPCEDISPYFNCKFPGRCMENSNIKCMKRIKPEEVLKCLEEKIYLYL